MNSFNRKKRAPFGEARADVGNRNKARATPATMTADGGDAHKNMRRMEPPSSLLSKPTPRARGAPPPASRIPVKNGAKGGVRSRSISRPRQQLGPLRQKPSPQRSSGPSSATATNAAFVDARCVGPNNDATRARTYKAEAYEAKIRIASQEQRIEALQAELEEVKFFREAERKSEGGETRDPDKKSRDDAELIEALAQECETMEKELGTSRARIRELEKKAAERSKSEDEMSVTRSKEKEQWEVREAELKKQLESDRTGLKNAKRDTTQGIKIIHELQSALKAARAERDDARTQLSAQCTRIELAQEQITAAKELEVQLKSVQNERDGARLGISAAREEVDALRKKCDGLERSNEELQDVLRTVQARSGEKMEQIKRGILEARAREDNLRKDHENLKESYERKAEEAREMKSALEGIASQFEAQQEKLLSKAAAIEDLEDSHATTIAGLKRQHSTEIEEMRESNDRVIVSLETRHAAAMEELEGLHATNIADLEQQHSNEIEQLRAKNESVASSLETRHAEELKAKDDHSESRERFWESNTRDLREALADAQTKCKEWEASGKSQESEIEALKNSLTELKETISTDAEGLREELESKNATLKDEKEDLARKLQQGLEIHKQTTMELEATTQELHELQLSSEAAQAEKETTDTLRKDYSAAVTLSIERGKKIQLLEKDAETHKYQVGKLVQRIKKMEKKSRAVMSEGAGVADEQLQAEVCSLREQLRESQEKISTLEQASLTLAETSLTDQLERELADAQKENDESRSKIRNLEEALKDMETALRAVSSCKLSQRKSPSPRANEKKRREIEDDALKEYYAHRVQTEK